MIVDGSPAIGCLMFPAVRGAPPLYKAVLSYLAPATLLSVWCGAHECLNQPPADMTSTET
jgi:hypothetical protein